MKGLTLRVFGLCLFIFKVYEINKVMFWSKNYKNKLLNRLEQKDKPQREPTNCSLQHQLPYPSDKLEDFRPNKLQNKSNFTA